MSTPDPNESDFRFWTEEKLRNADTDQQGHVNNAVMATLFEAGRIEVMERPEIAEVRKVTNIVVVKLLVNFRRELFFPGKVRIGSRIARAGRTSFDFESAIFAANGVVSTAEATCVLLDRATRKPTEIPPAMRAFLLGT